MGNPIHLPSSEPVCCLQHLSSELLCLIFQQVRDVDRGSLVKIRQVNRLFNAIATPIQYRTINLTKELISSAAERDCPAVLRNVYDYTHNIIAGSDLDPNRVRTVLGRMKRISSVRWRYSIPSLEHDTMFLPCDVLSPTHSIRLEVQDLPLRDFSKSFLDSYTRAIPAALLVSLKMAPSAPPLTTELHSLKKLVLAARKLETFHYSDRGQGTQFAFISGDRMPALRDLSMRAYDWNHDAEDVQEHWDFSMLEKLELNLVPLFPFLSSVDFGAFANLKELRLDDYSAHLPDRRGEATVLLHRLVRDHLTNLRALCVTVHVSLFPLDAVAKHAGSLEELRLRDHVGFGEDDVKCPTLRAEEIHILSGLMTRVKKMELDMDSALCDPVAFLRGLCQFRKLDELTLHVQTQLRPLGMEYPDFDKDLETAMWTFGFLNATRDELAMVNRQSASACPYRLNKVATPSTVVPWTNITLNVGGWKKVMVRRLGDVWRRQNENGIFAERCFVMERSYTGEIHVRDEKCDKSWDASNTSNPGTP